MNYLDTAYDMSARRRNLWLAAFAVCGGAVIGARLFWSAGVITTPMLFWFAGLVASFFLLSAIMAGRANERIGTKNQARGFEVLKHDKK